MRFAERDYRQVQIVVLMSSGAHVLKFVSSLHSPHCLNVEKSMKKLFIVVWLMLPWFASAQEKKITTFILVRHAEKASDGTDPELSAEGLQRAQRLSELLKNSNISTIYSTNFKRTRTTVEPLSNKMKVFINSYERMTLEALEDLVRENEGSTILIAGHSNTVPQMANVLLGTNQFQNFPDSEYGTILIISVLKVGKVGSFVRLSY